MQTTNDYLLVTYQLPTTHLPTRNRAGAVGCFWPVNRTVETTVQPRAGVNRIVEEPGRKQGVNIVDNF